VVQLDNGTQVECTAHRDGSYDIIVGEEDNDESSFHVTGTLLSNNAMEVVVNHTHRISMTTAMKEEAGQFQVHMWPTRGTDGDDYYWQVNVENPLVPSSSSMESPEQGSVGQGTIKSPMPGKISQIHFRVGDTVHEGDVLVVMEAMKMEHSIESPVAGVVTKLGFEVGAVVPDGAILATVEANNTGTTDDDSDQSEAV
jgi:biotin carboxyl carrier protein